jgi:hypothetical protein
MTAAIWSFLLGWFSLTWGIASVFLPVRLVRSLDGFTADPSRAMVAVIPTAITVLVVGGLVWYVVKRVKEPGWKASVSRGLGFSGLALSLIGLTVAVLFSPGWGGSH